MSTTPATASTDKTGVVLLSGHLTASSALSARTNKAYLRDIPAAKFDAFKKLRSSV